MWLLRIIIRTLLAMQRAKAAVEPLQATTKLGRRIQGYADATMFFTKFALAILLILGMSSPWIFQPSTADAGTVPTDSLTVIGDN